MRQPASHYSALFWFVAVMVCAAPAFLGGTAALPMLLAVLFALPALLVRFWNTSWQDGQYTNYFAALAALFILPLLYVVPLPASLFASLPGRENTSLALLLVNGGAEVSGTVSVLPRASLAAWMTLLPPLVVFACGVLMSARHLRTLTIVLLCVCALEAVLGLLQFGTTPAPTFYLGMERSFGSAVGTYPNRNHFAGLLYMGLMISLSWFIFLVGSNRQRSDGANWREKLVNLSSSRGHQAMVLAMLSVLLLLAIVFSRSRTGISVTMLGILLVSFGLSRRIGGEGSFGLTGTLVSIATGCAISIGLAPVLDRFAAIEPMEDGRFMIFGKTVEGIMQYFPFGSGPGTFVETYPAFQHLSQATVVINRAHNDYLEWVYGGGVLAAVLILVFLVLFVRRFITLWERTVWNEFRYIQVGAGLGMFLMLLHELSDYNLMRNMVVFAFMAALFVRLNVPKGPGVKVRVNAKAAEPSGLKPGVKAAPSITAVRSKVMAVQPAAGAQRNPFMDD